MKQCCNNQQLCYFKCNSNKNQCDVEFQKCLHQQCIILTKDKEPKHLTGKVNKILKLRINIFFKILVCDTATKLLLMGILSFGCKAYKDAQREACTCPTVANNEL